MGKNKIIILTVIFLIIALPLILYFVMNNSHQMTFKYIGSVSYNQNKVYHGDIQWLSLLDDYYEPFFDEQFIIDNFDVDLNDNFTFDKEKYTYIVTFGHELKSISYKYTNKMTSYFGIIPRELIGSVILSETKTNQLYIYRIRKINIVPDYHGDYYSEYIQYIKD